MILTSDYEHEIPAVFRNYHIISFKKELQKAGIDAVASLGTVILDLVEPDGMGAQDNPMRLARWAQHAADTIGTAINGAYDNTILRLVDFRYRLVFTIHRSFDEDTVVKANRQTFGLFGLTVEGIIKWDELKRSLLTDMMKSVVG